MNRIKIRQWMIEEGLSQAQIAREAKLTRAYVCQVIKGVRRNALVVTLLKGHGCPHEYLGEQKKPKAA